MPSVFCRPKTYTWSGTVFCTPKTYSWFNTNIANKSLSITSLYNELLLLFETTLKCGKTLEFTKWLYLSIVKYNLLNEVSATFIINLIKKMINDHTMTYYPISKKFVLIRIINEMIKIAPEKTYKGIIEKHLLNIFLHPNCFKSNGNHEHIISLLINITNISDKINTYLLNEYPFKYDYK